MKAPVVFCWECTGYWHSECFAEHSALLVAVHPFLLKITIRAPWFLVDTDSNCEWQRWQQVSLSVETCFSDWMTEWQWNSQVVFSHVDTTHERFSPPQDKATVTKDVVTPTVEEKRLMAWNSAGGGQNNRKTFHDIVIRDNSSALKFLLLWSL